METKVNWLRAIAAGIAGTIAFDLLGLLLTGQWWDIPSLIGAKTELGFAFGLVGHYSNGILLAILYAGIAPSLWGPYWLRAVTFATAETVALVWFFMLPLLGAGVAGLNSGPLVPFITLARHLAYALPLILILHPQTFRKYVTATK